MTTLLREGLTRDHVFVNEPHTHFIGTTRGFRVQLYAVSRAAVDAITAPGVMGDSIDRDSPAIHSIGRLTPRALTFEQSTTPGFRIRKRNLRRAVDAELARGFATSTILEDLNLRGAPVDVRPMVTLWAQRAVGDLVWGQDAASATVPYFDAHGDVVMEQFRTALHDTFRRVRSYSTRARLRVVPSGSRLTFSAEARSLSRNIRILREHAARALEQVPEGHSARVLSEANQREHIAAEVTLDDALTSYLAGIDTLTASIMITLRHVLHPDNVRWRDAIVDGDQAERTHIALACVKEALRVSPPGSLFNNRVVRDTHIDVDGVEYKMRRGTRLMPHVHIVQARAGVAYDPQRFLEGGSTPDFLAFGRGARSCPGKAAGLALASTFLAEFISMNPTASVTEGVDEPAKFNTMSDRPLYLEHRPPVRHQSEE
ncbi:cytochrome P450 [Microbacterium sp.]|uniref:cytochrome P450 n=1 Tax=Microbacterium sp. TaxID=51671 RepID=UPI003C7574A6